MPRPETRQSVRRVRAPHVDVSVTLWHTSQVTCTFTLGRGFLHMDINVARRPEQLLRGMDRLVAVVADAIPQLPSRPRAAARVPARWYIERGETRVQASVVALGGFPGSLRSMNRLGDVDLICTVRYLVVGEGSATGFAIPMRDVLSVSMVRPDRHSNHGLGIWYRDGDAIGSFFLRFRGTNRGISGLRRADQVVQFLVERGVTPIDPRDAFSTPALHVTWDDATTLAAEEIVWSGNGVASIGGWFGAMQDASRVWVTSHHLLWAGASGAGLNHISLANIIEARDGVGDRINIGIRDVRGCRYDLSFDLAPDYLELDREANPRVQLMDALARHGVPVSTASTPLVPWRAASVIRPMDRHVPLDI